MTTSFRGRSFRRSLIPSGPLLASAVLLLLGSVVACARSDAPPPSVEAEVEGYWLRPISRGSRMVPCGHGQHAWGWTPGRSGLWLVDAEGRELVATHFGDKRDGQVVDVLPTANPERAWVHVQESSVTNKARSQVYLVDHAGQVQSLLGDGAFELELAPSEGHERLWAVSQFDSQLRVLDTEVTGLVGPVSLSPAR
jgi:hypothetical protein